MKNVIELKLRKNLSRRFCIIRSFTKILFSGMEELASRFSIGACQQFVRNN